MPGVIQAARWQQMPSTVLFDIHAWRARRIPWGSTDPSSDYTRDVRQDLADGLLANGAFSSDEKLEFAAIWRLDPLALAPASQDVALANGGSEFAADTGASTSPTNPWFVGDEAEEFDPLEAMAQHRGMNL